MNEDAYNTIMELFKSGEIETIKFTKKGTVTVKWRQDPKSFQYTGGKVMNQVLEDLEMFEKNNKN